MATQAYSTRPSVQGTNEPSPLAERPVRCHSAVWILDCWLPRADEGTHELPLSARSSIRIDSLSREERASFRKVIDPRRLDADLAEASARELRDVLGLLEGARHASDPELHAPADLLGHFAADDDVCSLLELDAVSEAAD